MVRMVNTKSYNQNQFWQNYMDDFHKNSHSKNISLDRFLNNYILLTNDSNSLKVLYFDFTQHEIFDIDESEILSFIDDVAIAHNTKIGVQEHVDIILTILCKKMQFNYVSDLKLKKINKNLLNFIDKEKYKEEYHYIIQYLDS